LGGGEVGFTFRYIIGDVGITITTITTKAWPTYTWKI